MGESLEVGDGSRRGVSPAQVLAALAVLGVVASVIVIALGRVSP
jgi:hypothetical protein